MADSNLIKKNDLARAREIDFTYRFNDSIKKLIEALGVTRKIPKQEGTSLKAYKATGVLQDGTVAEGDTIPLSHYKTEAVTFAEITLRKWRKATSAEAIIERGFDQAVNMTTDAMLKDVQKVIKKDFFNFLENGTGIANGTTFQAVLAQIWGQLDVAYEDTEFEAVYFMNPLDAADYLSTASITLQQVFGMSYIENFLGLGTVIFNSAIPKGTIYGTAKENLVLYFVNVNGAGLDNVFEFTSDETGLIGIHEIPDYTNMTASDTVISGIALFAERIDGVIIGKINNAQYSVTVKNTDVAVVVNGTADVNATSHPLGTAISYASANNSIATVSANGVITGVAAGSTVVTATAGTASANVNVNVSAGA